MPIISAESIQNQIYRVSIMLGHGMVDNIVVTPDGIYSIYYVKNARIENHTGKILSIVQDKRQPNKSYLLFDCSDDMSGRRERISFIQVQNIRDVTPNDAYRIAVAHGFKGTVEEWLASLKGDTGASAYDLAVSAGFKGSLEDWLDSLRGKDAYKIAVDQGFVGTVDEWLESLKGKDAYALAVQQGFTGTLDEWLSQQGDLVAVSRRVDDVEANVQSVEEVQATHTECLTWIMGMGGTQGSTGEGSEGSEGEGD